MNSIPAPELLYDNISDEDIAPYLEGLKQLDSIGVDFIVMVCNTIHIFYDRLQSEIKTPILDLRKEVGNAVRDSVASSVLVLGTPCTVRSNLYDFDGMRCVKPTEEEVEVLSDAIFNFNKGTDKKLQDEKVRGMCKKYIDSGLADVAILGCSELGLMLAESSIPKIDTMDVLVEATIRRLESLG